MVSVSQFLPIHGLDVERGPAEEPDLHYLGMDSLELRERHTSMSRTIARLSATAQCASVLLKVRVLDPTS